MIYVLLRSKILVDQRLLVVRAVTVVAFSKARAVNDLCRAHQSGSISHPQLKTALDAATVLLNSSWSYRTTKSRNFARSCASCVLACAP